MDKNGEVFAVDGNNWVVKSNALIESKGKMTALEQKLILSVISEITPDDQVFGVYEVSLSEFQRHLGTATKHFYDEVQKAATSLLRRVINVESVENGKRKFLAMTYISSAEYVEGEGKIKISFDPKMKPYLLELKSCFTQYQLKNIMTLKGSHSIRIYELLKQYENMRPRKRELEIAELKRILGIEKKYSVFADFEKRILISAIEEINEKTDIWVTYKKIKKGRAIDRILFEFEKKHYDQEAEDIKALKEAGVLSVGEIRERSTFAKTISDKQLMALYEITIEKTDRFGIDPFEYMRLNYEYAKEKADNNLYTYLEKAIQNDYAKARIKLLGLE